MRILQLNRGWDIEDLFLTMAVKKEDVLLFMPETRREVRLAMKIGEAHTSFDGSILHYVLVHINAGRVEVSCHRWRY